MNVWSTKRMIYIIKDKKWLLFILGLGIRLLSTTSKFGRENEKLT